MIDQWLKNQKHPLLYCDGEYVGVCENWSVSHSEDEQLMCYFEMVKNVYDWFSNFPCK